MTATYIMNTIDRFDITPKLTVRNIQKAGRPVNQIIITDNGSTDERIKRWAGTFAHKFIPNPKNIGNPQALNNALDIATGDIIVIAGNDIELPSNWLNDAIKCLNKEVGLVGFNWRGNHAKCKKTQVHGLNVPVKGSSVFGTWVMTKQTFKKIGHLNEFSKYGLWDSAYNKRCEDAGLINGYVIGRDSIHVANDMDTSSDYRKMKDRELKKAKKGFSEYEKGRPDNFYLANG
jgi:glycosyltransferase involved in cell wall biosynthesis